MSRVAFVIPDYSVAKSMTTLSSAQLLAEAGFDVDVLTNGPLGGCPIHRGVRFLSSEPRESRFTAFGAAGVVYARQRRPE